MYQIPGVVSPATTPAGAVPGGRPTRDPPPGSPQDRERITLALNVVIRRLLTAGLDLQAALGLMDDHPASGKIGEAVDELDQAIRDIREAISVHPVGERPQTTTSKITENRG